VTLYDKGEAASSTMPTWGKKEVRGFLYEKIVVADIRKRDLLKRKEGKKKEKGCRISARQIASFCCCQKAMGNWLEPQARERGRNEEKKGVC